MNEKEMKFCPKFEISGGLIYIKNDGKSERAFLHLLFPYDEPERYISVLNSSGEEVGIIADINDLEEKSAEAVRSELKIKYYTPKIKKILRMKERGGFAYWTVITENGKCEFTVRDNFRNFFKIGENSAVIYDMDSNRFMIESITALDRKSRKTIDLYL